MTVTLTFTINDDDQKLLKNDLKGDAAIDTWLQGLVTGETNRGYKKMRTRYDQILMDDSSVTTVPSDKTEYINLVTARSDYKTAKQELE